MENNNAVICSAVINQAINFIFEHLDEEITVDDVARHCCYSKYHLMWMFKKDTDEAIYQFMKRIRLERSAWRLKVEKGRSITEIGIDYSYSSSNFATAFKKHLNMSPIDYRRKSEQIVQQSSFSHGISLDELERTENLLTIEWLNSFLVVYERKKGNYHNMSEEWCAFIKKYEKLASSDTVYVDCTIDDPSITDENSCMYDLFHFCCKFLSGISRHCGRKLRIKSLTATLLFSFRIMNNQQCPESDVTLPANLCSPIRLQLRTKIRRPSSELAIIHPDGADSVRINIVYNKFDLFPELRQISIQTAAR